MTLACGITKEEVEQINKELTLPSTGENMCRLIESIVPSECLGKLKVTRFLGIGASSMTFSVCSSDNKCYALRITRKLASSVSKREIELQKEMAKYGISPKIYKTCNKENLFFTLMEKGDGNLYQYLLTSHPQKEIESVAKQLSNIIDKLLDLEIQHGDTRTYNFIYKKIPGGVKVMLIDFGLSDKDTKYPEERDLVELIFSLHNETDLPPQVMYILIFLYNKFVDTYGVDFRRFGIEHLGEKRFYQIIKDPKSIDFVQLFRSYLMHLEGWNLYKQ